MKALLHTLIQSLTVILIPMIFFGGLLIGMNLNYPEGLLSSVNNQAALSAEDEPYINDIPFNTEQVTRKFFYVNPTTDTSLSRQDPSTNTVFKAGFNIDLLHY